MKTIVLDFSAAGIWKGIKHFIIGMLLAALAAAVSYAGARLDAFQVSTHTLYFAMFIPLVSESLQGVYKWVTTEQSHFAKEELPVTPVSSDLLA